MSLRGDESGLPKVTVSWILASQLCVPAPSQPQALRTLVYFRPVPLSITVVDMTRFNLTLLLVAVGFSIPAVAHGPAGGGHHLEPKYQQRLQEIFGGHSDQSSSSSTAYAVKPPPDPLPATTRQHWCVMRCPSYPYSPYQQRLVPSKPSSL